MAMSWGEWMELLMDLDMERLQDDWQISQILNPENSEKLNPF